MLTKELCIGAGELERPGLNALVMGLSYVAAGLVPLAPYLLLPVQAALPVSVFATIATLYVVGYAKGCATGRSRLRSGGEMAVVASAAALLGYLIGKGVGHLFGLTL